MAVLGARAAKALAELDKVGLLEKSTMGAMTPETFERAMAMAVGDDNAEATLAELQLYLGPIHLEATQRFGLYQQTKVEEWKLTRYKVTEEARKALPSETLADAQEAYSRYKHSKIKAEEWSTIANKKNRTNANSRVAAEEGVRRTLAAKALEVLRDTGLIGPSERLVPEKEKALLMRLSKGLRARTLRLRVQSVIKATRWVWAARNGVWLKCPEDFETYLIDMSTQKGVGVSTYESARYGLLYLEAAAGKRPEDMISMSPAIRNTISELSLQTSTNVQKKKKQAPQLLTSMLINLEKLVMEEEKPIYHRAYAWLKLVSFWCALRGDDATWIKASSLKYNNAYGLQGELARSKTTGPGKKVLSRPIVVGPDAYFNDKAWCTTGMGIWKGNNDERGNFLLLPSLDGEGFRQEGAEPDDRTALTVLSTLNTAREARK